MAQFVTIRKSMGFCIVKYDYPVGPMQNIILKEEYLDEDVWMVLRVFLRFSVTCHVESHAILCD